MNILTLKNATIEDLEGTFHMGMQKTFELLKAKGLAPLDWITSQNPPLKSALVVRNGLIDFQKIENARSDEALVFFEDKVKASLPETLIFMDDAYDWIGKSAKLHEVGGNTAYYTVCKGSSSYIFNVHIPELEERIGKCYFLTKESLADHVINQHHRAIDFINEHTGRKSA